MDFGSDYMSEEKVVKRPELYIQGPAKVLAIFKLIAAIIIILFDVLLLIGMFNAFSVATLISFVLVTLFSLLVIFDGIGAFKAIKGDASGAATVAKVHGIMQVLTIIGIVLSAVSGLISAFQAMRYSGATGFGMIVGTAIGCAIEWIQVAYHADIKKVMDSVSTDLTNRAISGYRVECKLFGISIFYAVVFGICLVCYLIFGAGALTQMLNSQFLYYSYSYAKTISIVTSILALPVAIAMIKYILVAIAYKTYKNV